MTPSVITRGSSMLLAFRAENARSFREEVELSLLATRLSDEEVVREIPWRDRNRRIGVLSVAGIFGANASGKSNLLKAMDDMRRHVLASFRHGRPSGGMPVHPFLLGGDGDALPTTYEVDLVLNEVRHEYGFRIDSERVIEEWAYNYPHGRAALLFHRRGDEVQLGAAERAKGRATLDILRPNALYLSTAAATNHPVLLPLYEWFMRNLLFADVNSRAFRQAFTAEMLDEDDQREQVMDLLREADLGITGATRRELDPVMRERIMEALSILRGEEEGSGSGSGSGEDPIEFEDFEVRLKHKSAAGDVELPPMDESMGTLVWFGMIGPVIEALRRGSVLLADELDASLHPTLVDILVRLFQSTESNPRRAQLIFNSHDVTLMGDSGSHTLGRDQIWFTEKDESGGTRLYPLTDLDPRKGEAVGRRYLAGRYGATPIVSAGQLERIVGAIASGPEE
ncbi:MAG TPA: ATP-binding protein [Solirubrobacterales bacterium]